MNQMIEIKYTIAAEIEYPKGEMILVQDHRANQFFDVNGNPIQVFYKQQKLLTPNVTIGNVTKTLSEINSRWFKNNNGCMWDISRESNHIACLGISEEKFDPNHAISFIAICERFIKEVFHL